MKNLSDVQDFIEFYYPKYNSSQAIADEMDLFMALYESEEIMEDSGAYRTLQEYSQEDIDNNQLKIDWMEARIAILERCIEECIDTKL